MKGKKLIFLLSFLLSPSFAFARVDYVPAPLKELFKWFFLALPDQLKAGDEMAVVWCKVIIFILVFAVLYVGVSKIPAFGEKKNIAVIISMIVSLMSTILIPTGTVKFLYYEYAVITPILVGLTPVIVGVYLARKVQAQGVRRIIYISAGVVCLFFGGYLMGYTMAEISYRSSPLDTATLEQPSYSDVNTQDINFQAGQYIQTGGMILIFMGFFSGIGAGRHGAGLFGGGPAVDSAASAGLGRGDARKVEREEKKENVALQVERSEEDKLDADIKNLWSNISKDMKILDALRQYFRNVMGIIGRSRGYLQQGAIDNIRQQLKSLADDIRIRTTTLETEHLKLVVQLIGNDRTIEDHINRIKRLSNRIKKEDTKIVNKLKRAHTAASNRVIQQEIQKISLDKRVRAEDVYIKKIVTYQIKMLKKIKGKKHVEDLQTALRNGMTGILNAATSPKPPLEELRRAEINFKKALEIDERVEQIVIYLGKLVQQLAKIEDDMAQATKAEQKKS
jgi:hypothetical protein